MSLEQIVLAIRAKAAAKAIEDDLDLAWPHLSDAAKDRLRANLAEDDRKAHGERYEARGSITGRFERR